jgi:hypothetical protein
LLAGQGARVLIADMNAVAGEALAAELRAAASVVPTNVAHEASAGAAVDRTVAAFDGQMGQAAYAASKAGIAGMRCRLPATWRARASA